MKATTAPEVTEAIVVSQEHDPHTLGPIGLKPAQLVSEATEMARALADIINSQKLFAMIQGRKYVTAEGWGTLGAMLGIVTVEDYVHEIEGGYEARVRLITARDGRLVGGASAVCSREEPSKANWQAYALRSMALTRATSKAFRLSYSWIMKLSGYEVTPAEEMVDVQPARPAIKQPTRVSAAKPAQQEPEPPDYEEPADYDVVEEQPQTPPAAPAGAAAIKWGSCDTITDKQQTTLWSTAHRFGWKDQEVRDLLEHRYPGIKTSKDIPAADLIGIMEQLRAGTGAGRN